MLATMFIYKMVTNYNILYNGLMPGNKITLMHTSCILAAVQYNDDKMTDKYGPSSQFGS